MLNDRSKRPKEIPEAEGNIVDFNASTYTSGDGTTTTSPSGGWFTRVSGSDAGGPIDASSNGIFSKKIPIGVETITTGGISTYNIIFMDSYNTVDISTNALANSPTNITTTFNGEFTQEEQDFPLELFFTYPFTMDPSIPLPNKLTTSYNNSDGKTTFQLLKIIKVINVFQVYTH